MNALDLYAKIEHLIEFYDEYDRLYSSYLTLIQTLDVQKILDVGCGNGRFSRLLLDNDYDVLGIDKSREMVKRACKLGVNASNMELSELQKGSYDCIVCAGDVLNYMRLDELNTFFDDISDALVEGGYFIADINTLHGFQISDGSVIKDHEDEFLTIDAAFENDILKTEIVYFKKDTDRYIKSSNTIYQYYHHIDTFKEFDKLRLLRSFDVSMFSDDSDKKILMFCKTAAN